MIDRLREIDARRMAFAKGIRTRWSDLPSAAKAPVVLALIALLFYLPFLNILPFAQIRTDLGSGGSDWSSVLFTMTIFAIIAVGLNVVIGLCGLLDLGYVGFFAVGAYSMALFGSPTSPVTEYIRNRFELSETWAVTWAACIPIALVLTMIAGVVLGAPTLRLRGDYLALVTMGFGEIIRIVARNSDFTGGSKGVSNIPKPPGPNDADGREFFNVLDLYRWYWLALVVLILVVLAVRRLERSRAGRAWMAIREDEDAAAIMGVPTFKFKLWAFAIGAALGGISGALFASRQAFIDPGTFDLQLSFLFVAMVVIGGSGNIAGVILGAMLLTYLPERFREVVVGDTVIDVGEWRNFAFGVALVLVMVLRPQGLIPNRRRARELKDRKLEAQQEAVDA
jgi:branched-chain amino acid transport system permease protein